MRLQIFKDYKVNKVDSAEGGNLFALEIIDFSLGLELWVVVLV